jgi:hypothetical protein
MVLLVSLTGGCALVGPAPKCDCQTAVKAEPAREKPLTLNEQRTMLSEGYSKLYASAGKLDLTDLVVYVKSEPANVEAIITAAAAFGGELKKDLERIARDYPGVRIDINVVPEIEKRTRTALAKDLGARFAPVVGRGGREYERTVLIGYAIAMAHERYLSRVMAEEEPDPGLKKFLLATEKRYNSLYDRTIALLDKEYFSNPSGKTKE